MKDTFSDARSQLSDLQATVWGEVGLVTASGSDIHRWPEESISAPTSRLFRHQDGSWKVALFHSVPIPDQPHA